MRMCLVFDFDGVIINSHNLQMKALEESYRKVVGKGEPPYKEFFLNSGDSLNNIFKKINLPLEMIPEYIKVSTENTHMILLHEGVKELLSELIEKGHKCALCTGKDRERTLYTLELLNLDCFFKSVVCSDDVMFPKPHPESLLKSIQNLNGDIYNSVMIGDGINDILCAKKAGVMSIAVTWGDTSIDEVIQAEPDAVSDTMQELGEQIEQIYVDLRETSHGKNLCRP